MKPKIGIIVGSNRPTRIALDIAKWAQKTMASEKLQLELVDLAEINLPFLDEPEIPAKGSYSQDHTKKWSELISSYDGFVLLFPQYNWGYPAVLKNALDYLYTEWAHKPVSIMCYGNHGGFQGALAMGLVTRGLHMHGMTTNPPLNIDKTMFDKNGQFKNLEAAFAKHQKSLVLVKEEFEALLVV